MSDFLYLVLVFIGNVNKKGLTIKVSLAQLNIFLNTMLVIEKLS